MPQPPPQESVRISRRILDRYLLDDEIPVVATRQHWARLAEPFATMLLSLVAVAAVTASLEGPAVRAGGFLWLVWFAVAGRALWRLLEWHNEWFVATDRRMLLVYGFITQRVAMMPLTKVTDMNYGRSVPGRLLGYGRFVLESAGQDQALREIDYLPDPDEKYRRICATIFAQGRDEGERRRAVTEAFDEHVSPDRGWEAVDRHELPTDWEWVDDEARRARESTRRQVAVDPDPTPWE
ncbi:PH domain-containing protein [Ornithinimicrobium avium]|uniref:PH domain-containing protein n=1 Tax=Ornithinimicrobium avium TaxID=2283195 RepID=A0A345NMM9_9MICO|nr:PH domain-containing protein [Ornithinimicrobium avium]AXH96287.1 PH domain-containing protein [Ornithinimicrobium avium]